MSEKAVRRKSGGGSSGKWKWAKDGEAEEPVGGAGESEADRKGARRSEKAKVSEEGGLTRSLEARNLERLWAYLHGTTNIKHAESRPRPANT